MEGISKLIKYRELLSALVARHLSMRYRGSVLGFLWSFLNPLLLMLVYTLVFRYYIRFQDVNNYSVFLFCGLLPWIWLSSSLQEGASSVVSSGHLITKSLFPAELLPSVSVITGMVHFILSLPILLLFMIYTGIALHPTLLLLPILVLVQFLFCYGLNLMLSALNVYYRDVQHLLANLLSFLFFLCPILYPLSSVPEKFRFTMEYNPFSLLTIFYHNLVLEGSLPSLRLVGMLLLFVALTVWIGHTIFNYHKEGFAEVL